MKKQSVSTMTSSVQEQPLQKPICYVRRARLPTAYKIFKQKHIKTHPECKPRDCKKMWDFDLSKQEKDKWLETRDEMCGIRKKTKRAKTSWFAFCDENRQKYRAQGLSFQEIAKCLGDEWQKLTIDEKQKYKDKAAHESALLLHETITNDL